jgi:hypothetical protein
MGIRDIGGVPRIGITKALTVFKSTGYQIKSKRNRYDCVEIDEF